MRRSKSQRPVLSRGAWRRLASFSGVAAAALALGGCFLGPESPPAGIDIPPAYREGPRNHDAALPSLLWWRGFRSKQLTDLIEEALASNLDISAAVARVIQADAQARITGATLLPSLDFSANASRSRPPGGPDGNSFSTLLSASYEIDFWGKNRALLRSSEELAVASRFDREVVSLSVVATVANVYFEVLSSYDRLRVTRNNLAAATRVLTLIQQRFNVGTASALDVAQQEILVDSQRAAIPPLQQTLRQDMATLALLVGRPPEHVPIRGGSMNQIAIPPVTPGIPSDLLGQRPDIREAEAQLAAANANVEAARAAFLPTISLTADGGFTSAALRTLLRPESALYSVAAGLVQPIFDGGRLLGQFDLQKGKQDELLQLYRRAIINGFADVDRALIAVQQTAERERLQRAVVNSSRRAFEIVETRLREGTVDLVTTLIIQQALFQAEDNLAQARLLRLQAMVSLFQALGGGWQKPIKAAALQP